jgi:propanol-preferring alcohol dehydrogenase
MIKNRIDCEEFLELSPRILVRTEIEVFSLEHANEVLAAQREGSIKGSGVLVP